MKISLNNSTTHYIVSGQNQEPTIVFIHGFPFNHNMWKPQLEELSSDCRMILYDVRGHGSSDVGDGQYTIELFTEDLIALLNHLNIEKSVLCGLSMGGYIALRTFEKYPDRINGLVLCDTKSESDTNEAKIKRALMIKTIKESGIEIFAEDFMKSVFWDNTFHLNPKIVEDVRQMIRDNSPIGICGTLLALASRTDTTQALSSINIPTCIIAGKYDKLIPPSAAQAMHKAITRSDLHIIPNAGHISNMENSGEFNKILASFLKTIKQ